MTAQDTATIAQGPVAPADAEPERKGRRRKIVALLLLLVLFLGLLAIAIWYLLFRQPIVPTIPLLPDTRLPAYQTSIYSAERPVGIAATADGGRIYVATGGSTPALMVFDSGGNQIGAGKAADGSTSFVPLFAAIDPLNGDVYLSERNSGGILVYDKDGNYQRNLSIPERPAIQAIGIAFDAKGNLYITDTGRSKPDVVEINREAKVLQTFGDSAGLNYPNGVAVDGNGYVYLADSNNGRLVVFAADGTQVATVGRGVGSGLLGLPRDVTVDGTKRIYVVDTTGSDVAIYRTVSNAATGQLEYVGAFGTEGASDGNFSYPSGVVTDGRGRIYVSDTMNNRVQVWSY